MVLSETATLLEVTFVIVIVALSSTSVGILGVLPSPNSDAMNVAVVPTVGVNSSTNLSASKLDDVMMKDAILPLSANSWPDELRISKSFTELSLVSVNSNPPNVPPLNNTVEPVICPLSLSIRLLFDYDMVVVFIPKPPIVPNVALIPPCRYTLFVANP